MVFKEKPFLDLSWFQLVPVGLGSVSTSTEISRDHSIGIGFFESRKISGLGSRSRSVTIIGTNTHQTIETQTLTNYVTTYLEFQKKWRESVKLNFA
jgi:hypothetical protein